jgi:hypothetical protein
VADDNVTQIGGGGRLYADAREKESTARQRLVNLAAAALHEDDGDEDPDDEESVPLPPPIPLPVPPAQRLPAAPKPQKTPRDWREVQSTILELIGISLISVGCWEIRPWLGLIVLGFCLILMGLALSGVTLIPQRRDE